MSKKNIIISVIVILIILFGILGFYFHDDIQKYLEDQPWLYTTPYAEKEILPANNYINGYGLMTVRDNNLYVYDKKLNLDNSSNINTSSVMFRSNGIYTVIASKEKGFIKLFIKNKEQWSKTVPFDVKGLNVNSKGYVCVVFSQNGYKSGVRVYSTNGDEISNAYLGSTYAIDADVSNDGKIVYLVEVDLNGINATSNLKLIEMSTNSSKVYQIGEDEIVTCVDIKNQNDVYIQTNKAIYLFNNQNELKKIFSFENKNIGYASIINNSSVFIVEKSNKILRTINELDYSLELEDEPQFIDSMKDKIAMCFENEIWVVNDKCNVIKKVKVTNGLVDIRFINDGKTLALIHNGRIELVSI